jgi:CBS domain-containing protein
MKVCDAMTPDVQLCTPQDTLKDAAEAMMALNVGLLPVTDGDRLVGMISDRDIATRGVALGLGPDSPVRTVMTEDVKYCFDDQELEEVTQNMGDIQVRRLPVVNRDKRLVGIIALGDIARAKAGDGTAEALSQISEPAGQSAGSLRHLS